MSSAPSVGGKSTQCRSSVLMCEGLSRLETLSSLVAVCCSSEVEESIGAYLKTSIIGSSVLFAEPKADSLRTCVGYLAACTAHPSSGKLYKQGPRVTEIL